MTRGENNTSLGDEQLAHFVQARTAAGARGARGCCAAVHRSPGARVAAAARAQEQFNQTAPGYRGVREGARAHAPRPPDPPPLLSLCSHLGRTCSRAQRKRPNEDAVKKGLRALVDAEKLAGAGIEGAQLTLRREKLIGACLRRPAHHAAAAVRSPCNGGFPRAARRRAGKRVFVYWRGNYDTWYGGVVVDRVRQQSARRVDERRRRGLLGGWAPGGHPSGRCAGRGQAGAGSPPPAARRVRIPAPGRRVLLRATGGGGGVRELGGIFGQGRRG